MNNTTRMIDSGNERFVLRIYNNHNDVNIVRLEHEVLALLQAKELPFQVPTPVHNRRNDTISASDNGKLAALFRYIDGERPSAANPAHIHALGLTAGRLSAALSEIEPIGAPIYSPYYLMESTYLSMDREAFLGIATCSEELASRRSSFEELQREREQVRAACESIAELPKQWIHGDLVFNNTVSIGDEIVGVLDFEFVTVDVRAMELAVIMVDLIKPHNRTVADHLKLFLSGYMDIFPLSEQELTMLPTLMKLRLLDVALHFALRYKEGLDEEHVLCGIIDETAYGCRWINDHGEDVWR